jgi:hypothetical protein
MMISVRTLGLLVITSTLPVGCVTRIAEPGPASAPVLAATRPSTAPADVPIVYSEYGFPRSLTDQQREQVLMLVRDEHPGKAVWFVLVVRNSRPLFRRPSWRVKAYLAPDTTDGRASFGRCVIVTNTPWVPTSDDDGPRDTPFVETQFDYVQIGQETRLSLTEAPPIPDLPFPKPKGFSAAELVEIVDFVRHLPSRVSFADSMNEEPINSVRRRDDKIEVQTGWSAAMLNGSGHGLRCRRGPAGLELVERIYIWRS